ncbi:phage tail protein [Fonticella tunisiensis]|uniref:Phage-related protein n=1 Tax=Fonticella tunisiensis TaxID=1096341 RepID=A0A4R7KTS7_9CLOT|nr:hypothetical protein [Fonticella tunisiensis]TDT63429.1 hypothetical protein EDD71_102191 [Fonticella tunisiensis]
MTLEELKVVISAETEPLKQQLSKIKDQMSGLEKSTNQITSGIKGAFKKLLAGVIALKIGQKIGQAITSGVRESLKVEAAIQQIKRIMGESSNQFLKWAETQALAFNMSQGQAIRYGAVFGNLVSGFAKNSQEAMTYTTDLLKASSIIASSTGRSMEDVMERIRSGLLGNTEAIEDLGVNVNVAMIESTEAFRKFANGKSWQQLDFQTQQQIRLMAILEQTTKKYGDTVAQNTSSQLQQLVAILDNVRLKLGQAFTPILQIILPALTALAQKLYYVTDIIAQFSQALFGKTNNQGGVTQKQIQNTNNQAKAMTKLGNATEKAGKQAKGALAGFDEINSLSKGSSSAGDEGTAGPVGGVASAVPGFDTGGFASATTEVSEKVKNMADSIKKAFKDISNTLKKNKNQIVSSLSGIGAGIGTYLIGTHWDDIMKIVPKAMEVAKKALTSINGPILVASVFVALFTKAVIELWQENEEFRDNIIKAWNGIKDTLNNIWNIVLKPIFDAFVDMLLDIYNEGIKPLWDKWKEFVNQIVLLMTDLWNNGMKPVVDWIVKTFGPNIVDTFKWLFNEIKRVVLLIIDIVSNILGTFSGVISGVRQIFNGLIDFVAGVFTGNWSRAWNGIKEIFSGVFNILKSIASGVFNSIGDIIFWVVDRIKSNISGIKNTFSGVFNSLYSIIKAPLNNVISAINNSLGKIRIDIPWWVPGIGGRTFSVPKIPYLAQGGYVGANNPMLAVIGDNRTEGEIVAPESKIYEQTYRAIKDALGSNSGDKTLVLNLNVGNSTIARIVIDSLREYARQHGEIPIPI